MAYTGPWLQACQFDSCNECPDARQKHCAEVTEEWQSRVDEWASEAPTLAGWVRSNQA